MGTAIHQRYVLLGPIGHGGLSQVYQAIDAVSARPLAVKMLAPALAGDDRARAKVRREAMITSRLNHPGVPKVYDVGDAPLPDGTVVPYVVLELFTGVALAGRLASGSMPWREAVSTAASVADVLAVIHRRGVVHRDLAPENIMVTSTGLKIIDFGLAATVDDPADDPAGPRPADDVYALGVLLYQMLTGRSPYTDTGGRSVLARFRGVAPTPVLDVPGLPPPVADFCRACMAKRPEERPTSAAAALALWALLTPPRAPEPQPPTEPPAPAELRAPGLRELSFV